MKPPAFQFYADDFIAGTSDMTAEEVGQYIRLLCYQWSKGSIPSDPDRLTLICGGNAKPHAVAKFGICQDGAMRNERMEEERAKQAEYRARQAENGKKRWVGNAKPHANPDAVAMPSHMPNACSPSPSPLPIEKKRRRKNVRPELTDEEWLANLKTQPENHGKDIDGLRVRMFKWCQDRGETPTRRRLEVWLKKEEPMLPMQKPAERVWTPEEMLRNAIG